MDTTSVSNTEFLMHVFGALPEDEVIATCAFTETPEHRAREKMGWPVYQPTDPRVTELLSCKPPIANTYYCISSVRPSAKLSRGGSALVYTYVLPLDDIGHGQGAKYSPDQVPLEPSYALETSEGNWQYGYILETPLPPHEAQVLIAAMAQEHGDSGGSMGGKIIRLPNGINNKEAYADTFECRLTEWRPEVRYTDDDIIRGFGLDPEDIAQRITKAVAVGSTERGEPDFGDAIWEYLVEADLVISAPNEKGLASIVCPWNEGHTDGNVEAAYSPLGCGGEYAGSRQFKCLHDHDKDKTWIDLARWVFLRRYVFVTSGKQVADRLRPGVIHPLDAFKVMHSGLWYKTEKGGTRYIVDDWLQNRQRLTADRVGFGPSQSQLYVDDFTTERVFNTYQKVIEFEKTQAVDRIQPILDHFEYLFGKEADRALSFFAWTVHRPEVRIKFAMLHYSNHHGTGRGFIKELIGRVLGHRDYVKTANLQDFMTGQFNEWLYRSLLVTFDEVRQKAVRYTVQDKLRELITEPKIMVNIKHGMKADVEVYANLLFMSNHIDALQIPDNDRRLWVIGCVEPPRGPTYYAQLYQLLDDPEAMRQFYWFLARQVLVPKEPFNPHGRAPDTVFRRLVRMAGDSEIGGLMREFVDELRKLGIKSIARSQFVSFAKDYGIPTPLAESNAQEWRAFNAAAREAGIHKDGRFRTNSVLKGKYGASDRDALLALDVQHSVEYTWGERRKMAVELSENVTIEKLRERGLGLDPEGET